MADRNRADREAPVFGYPSPAPVPSLDALPGPPTPVPPPSLPIGDDGKVFAAPGYSPPERRLRREAVKAARQVDRSHRQRLMALRKAEAEALRAEERRAAYLPKGGEPGPMAGRTYRRLKVVPHRVTSEVLAGAYPFLAEEGLGRKARSSARTRGPAPPSASTPGISTAAGH